MRNENGQLYQLPMHQSFIPNQLMSGLGRTLELVFDFKSEYDLESFVLQNYVSETFDVDRVELEFFDDSRVSGGSFTEIDPASGNTEDSLYGD